MLKKFADTKPITLFPGVVRRTLNYGDKMLIMHLNMAKGGAVPWHTHPYEQIGTLISGKLQLGQDDATFEAGPGDTWCFPANARHMAVALEDCVAYEVFSPARDDYKD